MLRWLLGWLAGASVASLAYRRKALTLDGALTAAPLGAVVYARGGLPAAGALLAFFASSSALSRFGERRKQSLPLAQAKGARRDGWQVLANGGIASLSIAVGQPNGFLGALAAAAADTWATELGLLAPNSPRLITTLRRVPAGTSGGVTLQGLAASLGGAMVVGVAWTLLGGNGAAIRLAAVAGVCASLADSLLGATVQATYQCADCGDISETPIHKTCGGRSDLVHGIDWVTNDVVNALATLVGGVLGALAYTPNAAGHVRGGG